MNPTRLLLLLVALLAVGGGVWMLMSDQTPAPVSSEPVAHNPAEQYAQPAQPLEARDAAPEAASSMILQRNEVVLDNSNRTSPQGVRGRVLSPTGVPTKGCSVFLVESSTGADLFRMMQMAQKGITLPPIASIKTDDKGTFALGLEACDPNKALEIRVVSDTYADFTYPGVRLQPNDWYDAGDIKLLPGLTLQGQVTVAGTNGMPIAEAEVSIRPASGAFDVSLIPGRERGIIIKTDAGGFYRATNVPAGLHNVAAVAPGYARLIHSNVTVNEQSENRLNFDLAQGLSIQGKVIDASGNGVARAKVMAVAMSSKTPVSADTFSDEGGNFEILGLLEGPYQLTAKAEGFVDANEKAIPAGSKGLELVVEKQGAVRLTVLGKNGQLVREYTVLVKKFFAGQPASGDGAQSQQVAAAGLAEPSYGNTMIPMQTVRNPKDGVALIEGLDPDTYALQINARGYAMAFSDPFTIAVDVDSPALTVVLNEGGVIAGQVVGAAMEPVAGVTVETRPNDLDDNPFTNMFASMIPSKVTRTQVQTDASGRFEIKLLNAGRYQLRFTHPEYVERFLKDNDVVVGQALNLQPTVLAVGTILTGTVRVSGKPTGQVKVSVSSKSDPNSPLPRTAGFQCEAYTDAEGRYVMPKRLAPGLYEVMAAQQTLPNPLLQIVQFQRSKQEISVGSQGQFVIDFNLEDPK
ncbi:MAG: carboxypeptidase-like regulatory domain-containing protein [Planctomycetota bacterium]